MTGIGFNLLIPDRERGQHQVEKYTIKGKTVYFGKASVNFSTFDNEIGAESSKPLKDRPWLIAHPDCEGKQLMASGIETYALGTTCYTLPLGVMVED